MKTIKFLPEGNVCSPKGFSASGICAGLKASKQKDMALLYCSEKAKTIAAFTSNIFAAAPVILGKQTLANNKTSRAIIINSGNANACTGEQGIKDARRMCSLTAELLNIEQDEVLVSSTGRIGTNLPMDIIEQGIGKAAKELSVNGGKNAADAIMTTDTKAKTAAVSLDIAGKNVTIGAMVKGAGMIAPQMKMAVPQATMLAFFTTDANISWDALQNSSKTCLENSFNKIIIDGDTSTNDSLFVMSSALAENELIVKDSENCQKFSNALRALMDYLAKEMVLDGEGVTRFIDLKITGAANDEDARKIAEAIARSPLCKTAWFGADPNWGRILAAAGYSGVEFNPEEVDLDYNSIPVVRKGKSAGTTEEILAETMQNKEVEICLKLGEGRGACSVWTCDLSYEYVKINAEYTT